MVVAVTYELLNKMLIAECSIILAQVVVQAYLDLLHSLGLCTDTL